MGTGLNAQVIATSSLWRFEFYTGVILVVLTLPLNYVLTKYYFGILGPAIANLFSFTVYNAPAVLVPEKEIHLQPFTWQTIIHPAVGCRNILFMLFSVRQLPWVSLAANKKCGIYHFIHISYFII